MAIIKIDMTYEGMHIPENLYLVRKHFLQYSQKFVGDCLGVSDTMIRNAEKGRLTTAAFRERLISFYLNALKLKNYYERKNRNVRHIRFKSI